jgi:hypothetical protein
MGLAPMIRPPKIKRHSIEHLTFAAIEGVVHAVLMQFSFRNAARQGDRFYSR